MNPFEGMGLETTEAVEYFNLLGGDTYDLQDAKRFQQLRDTFKYMGELPKEQRSLFLRRALQTNPEDKLDMAWQYSQLHINKDIALGHVKRKDAELEAFRQKFQLDGFEEAESEEFREMVAERQGLLSVVDTIDNEIALFDR